MALTATATGWRVAIAVVTLMAVAPSASSRPSASASSLSRRPFTVVAVVDSGINPYHVDFRRPELTAHPATYIEGYPKGAAALRLSLRGDDLADLRARDQSRWSEVGSGELVWIPGTNIVGAVDVEGAEFKFFDTNGHGTAVASLAGGRIHGPNTDNILIVALNGFDRGLQWAAKQPWIDVITNSWSVLTPVTDQTAEASYEAVADGKIVCFASGNLSAPIWFLEGQGPSWHVNVGAAAAKNRGEYYYTGYPNDVMGLTGTPAASHESVKGEQEFGGTSGATPAVCGLIAKTLSQVRQKLGDYREGPHGDALAVGNGRGALKDRKLTRLELEDAIHATAVPAASPDIDPSDPSVLPAIPGAQFLRGGYGIVDGKSARHAVKVILGQKKRPARELEDQWLAATDMLRNGIWGDPP